MDKYEKLFHDIDKKTNQGALTWRQVNPATSKHLIFGYDSVLRAFHTVYHRGHGEPFDILLLLKNHPNSKEIESWRNLVVEILFFKDKYLVFTLTRGHVEAEELSRFAQYIEENTEEARELFAGFSSEDEEYQASL